MFERDDEPTQEPKNQYQLPDDDSPKQTSKINKISDQPNVLNQYQVIDMDALAAKAKEKKERNLEQQQDQKSSKEYQPLQENIETTQFTSQLQQSQQMTVSSKNQLHESQNQNYANSNLSNFNLQQTSSHGYQNSISANAMINNSQTDQNNSSNYNNQVTHQTQVQNPSFGGYPLPKPKTAVNSNRPHTQNTSLYNSNALAKDMIYGNNKSNNSNDTQLSQVNGNGHFQPIVSNINRASSYQRPTTQGGVFAPQGFSNTSYDQQMVNSMSFANQQAQFQMTSFNRKNSHSDKPPINNFMPSSQRQQFSQDKNGRRQIIAQILKMQNNSTSDVLQSNIQIADTQSPFRNQKSRDISQGSFINLKRKKIKELLFGSGSRGNYGFNAVEREDLQLEKRNLKVQMNVMKDENTRLKTKLQIFQQELLRKDKDIEILSLKVQQSYGSGANQAKDSSIFESFLVSQLKKQIRDQKTEIDQKDQAIDKLRRDIKLTRIAEIETELQTYIDECQRLREMLNQAMLQNSISQQQQMHQEAQENYVKEQARIEEAFYQKEVQLQQELEVRNQLESQLQEEKQARAKLEKKWQITEVRLKKFNELVAENKRKQKIISDKNTELTKLKDEIETLRDKAKERDQINNKNKELVTKYYSYQSQLDYKEKKIQELSKKNQELEEQLKQTQKNHSQNQSNFNSVSPARMNQTYNTKMSEQTRTAVQQKQASIQFQSQYTQNQLEVLFRAFKGQPLINSNDSMAYKNYYNGHKNELQAEIDHIKGLNIKKELLQALKGKEELIKQLEQVNSFGELEKHVEIKLGIIDKDKKKYLLFQLILAHSKSLTSFNLSPLLDQLIQSQVNTSKQTTPVEYVSQTSRNEESISMPQQQQKQTEITQKSQKQYQNQQETSKDHVTKTPTRESKSRSEQQQEQSEQPEQQYEIVNTVRVNENIGETTAQFIPPQQLNQTPFQDDKQSPNGHGRNESSNNVDKNESYILQTSNKNSAQKRTKMEPEEDAYEEDEFEKVTDQDASQLRIKQDAQKRESQILQKSQKKAQIREPEDEDEDNPYGDEMDKSQEVQISEDQMLNIAEYVFQSIAEKLKQRKLTVKRAFAKKSSILDEFEGEQNVVIIQAQDFLDSLKTLGITQLSELEIACLMRVLSKPEINHAIVFSELDLVLENFGIVDQENKEDPDALKDSVEKKKQKLTKKKQMQVLINSEEGTDLYEALVLVAAKFKYEVKSLMTIFKPKQYEQIVKSKKKELKVELIKKEDFLEAIRVATQIDLNQNPDVVMTLQSILQIDPKYSDILQIKSTQQLFTEVINRYQQEEKERKALKEFYQPSQEEDEDDYEQDGFEESNNQHSNERGDLQVGKNKEGLKKKKSSERTSNRPKKQQEVINFEDLMKIDPDEEEDYYAGSNNDYLEEGEDSSQLYDGSVDGVALAGGFGALSHGFKKKTTLNAISEDAINEDQSSPNIK